MSVNRKILNSTLVSLDGHDFRSKAEMRFYMLLKESGLRFGHEDITITLVEKFVPAQWYSSGKLLTRAQLPMTYKPDFTVVTGGTTWLIDIKGFETDRFVVKRKLLLKMITDNPSLHYAFMEVKGNIKEMNAAIDYLKNYEHVSRETQMRPSGSDETLS